MTGRMGDGSFKDVYFVRRLRRAYRYLGLALTLLWCRCGDNGRMLRVRGYLRKTLHLLAAGNGLSMGEAGWIDRCDRELFG